MQRTTIALATAALLLAGSALVRPPSQVALEEQVFARKLRAAPADIVIAGDSRALIDASPAAMQSVLPGLRVLNEGFHGCGFATPGYLEFIGSLADPASPDRAIVACVTPWSLTPQAQASNRFTEWSRRPAAEVWQASFAAPALARFGPLARPDDKGDAAVREGGWISMRIDPPRLEPTLWIYRNRNFAGGNRASDAVAATLLAAVRRWRAEGVRVFGVRPPVHELILAAERDVSGFDEADFVRRFTEAGGAWLTVPGEYTTADGSHLQDTSAEEWSRALARLIAR